jgi:hypothetical protein
MAAEAIKVRATAAKLYKETGDERIEAYKTMPLDDLRSHIEAIQKGSGGAAPAKGKAASASNGSAAPRQKGKGASTTAAPAKGKAAPAKPKGKSSASTSAPAKSKTQKSSPVKGKAATGTAKRPTTAAASKGKGSTATKGKSAPAKGHTSPAKPKAAAKSAPAKARGRKTVEGAARIDNKAVDWKADWNGGKTGKRAEVMAGLRRYKGDKAKVFDLLAPKARTFYKGRTKNEAERMLVWLIGRVAFDFVTATGQHEMGTRDAHGASENPINVRRRERREEQRKAEEKAARAAKRASTAGKGKVAPRGKGKPATAAKGKGRS